MINCAFVSIQQIGKTLILPHLLQNPPQRIRLQILHRPLNPHLIHIRHQFQFFQLLDVRKQQSIALAFSFSQKHEPTTQLSPRLEDYLEQQIFDHI